MLDTLENLIKLARERKSSPVDGSYTNKLLIDKSLSNLLVYEPSTGKDFLSLASFIRFSNVLSILNSNRNSF